jgi:hypothetical protein
MSTYFVDDRHALYVGWVVGLALKHGLPVTLVDDENGNHTDRFTLAFGDDVITVVVPPPPSDWMPCIDGSIERAD